MLLPIGMDDSRVTRWPVVTLSLALLTLGITASVAWHAHLTRDGAYFESVNAYLHEHPDLEPTEACAPYLQPRPTEDPDVPHPRREPGDSRKLASLCVAAMEQRAASQPLWLMRPEKGLAQLGLLTHGLAFPNIPAAVVGLFFLLLVLGSLLENRWGRERFAGFWLAASAVSAFAYQQTALTAADPLAGGGAMSAACLGAFLMVFGQGKLCFWALGAGESRRLVAPAWSVALVWLVTHLAVLALTDGRTPADTSAEFAGLGFGLAAGLMARLQNWQVADPTATVTASAEPDWVKSAIVPVKAQADARMPSTAEAGADAGAPDLLMFGDAPMAAQQAIPEDRPLFADLPRFDDPMPLAPPPVLPTPVPLDADGGWARFADDTPALAPRVADPVIPAPVAIAPTATAIKPPFAEPPATSVDDSSFAAAILGSAFPEPAATGTPYWTLVGRDHQGLLLRDEDGVATRVDPRHLLAVAIGVVQAVDVGAPGPALLIDLVMDLRPPRAVRLRPTPDVLAAGWPSLPRQDAVVALARELASGGAIRVPQVPEWPGPPWSTFADARSLTAAWQLALRKR